MKLLVFYDLLSFFSLFVCNNVDYIFELLVISNDRLVFFHEFVKIIHYLVLELLEISNLSIDLIQPAVSILTRRQGH